MFLFLLLRRFVFKYLKPHLVNIVVGQFKLSKTINVFPNVRFNSQYAIAQLYDNIKQRTLTNVCKISLTLLI